MKTGIKIFDYKGYIEYFRKRKISGGQPAVAKAIDKINKISGLNYNSPVANMILHDFLSETIESADAIVKSKSEIIKENPRALIYSVENALKLLVEKNILSKSTLDDGEWYALNEKYFNEKDLEKEFRRLPAGSEGYDIRKL